MNVQTNKSVRVVGWDVARGALMIYIVCVIHSVFWFNLIPQGLASILLFEMPPIFIVSGAAYFYSSQKKTSSKDLDNYLKFLLTRIVRVLVPYWGYALTCAIIVLIGSRNNIVIEHFYYWLNPYYFGGNHTIQMLNWHLWFVFPFLLVTALLPTATKLKVPANIHLLIWAVGGIILFSALDYLSVGYIVKTVTFYLIWATFGFVVAKYPARFELGSYCVVFGASLLTLCVLYQYKPLEITLNMQINKFPPNTVFFVFSCAWVSILMITTHFLTEECILWLSRSCILKPFIKNGYSIYLWQGLGYSVASFFGRKINLPIYLIVIFGIAFTVALGVLASPLERIRINMGRSQ